MIDDWSVREKITFRRDYEISREATARKYGFSARHARSVYTKCCQCLVRQWTDEEDRILEQDVARLGLRAVAAALGRTTKACRVRIDVLMKRNGDEYNRANSSFKRFRSL